MQEETYSSEIAIIYEDYNLSDKNTQLIIGFLKTIAKQSESLNKFLNKLNQHPITIINFNSWKRFFRILWRASHPIMNEQTHFQLSTYLINSAKVFFPYPISSNIPKNFKQLLEIAKGIKINVPKNLNDEKEVLIYLNTKWTEQFAIMLVETINTEVLIDKKNRNPHSLKINQLYAPFISLHFPKILPQLQRLLVRSTSNLEVWQEFFSSVSPLPHFHPHILELFQIIKQHIPAFPQIATSLINSITNDITDPHVCKEVIQLFSSLIANEHQSKRKIIYLQMLSGIISSLTSYANDQLSNQLFITFINTWPKFSDEEDFKIIASILNKMLVLIKNPCEEIVEALKPHIKSNSKYLLINIGITLNSLFTPLHFQKFQSLVFIENHFKNQMHKLVAKIDSCWQWLPHFIAFISKNDSSNLDYFNEDYHIFKKSSISLELVERKSIIKIIIAIIGSLEQHKEEVPNYLLVSLCMLLQNTRDRETWKLIHGVSPQLRLSTISRVVYPSLWFNISIKKNDPFQSLVRFILKEEKWQVPISHPQAYKVLIVAGILHIPIKAIGEPHKQTIQHLIKLGLYNYDVNENQLPNKRKLSLVKNGALIGLDQYLPNFIFQALDILLNKQNYVSNLVPLQSLKQSLQMEVNLQNEQMLKNKNLFQQGEFYVEQKPILRKIYASDINIKMMSQAQVKQEKYREHFLQMFGYFNRLMSLLIQKGSASNILPEIWTKYLAELIRIAGYPEHRPLLYSLTKKSCEQYYKSTLHNKKSGKIEKIEGVFFYSYAGFIGELFVNYGALITPSVGLMEKCEKFLQKVITMQFEKLNNSYILKFVNMIGEYIIENMEFDISLKKIAVQFYSRCADKKLDCWNPSRIYSGLVKNINILSSSPHILNLIEYCISSIAPERCSQLFEEILNFISSTKKLILIAASKFPSYKPLFEDYIKLRILSFQGSTEIQDLAKEILERDESHLKSIIDFNMKKFIEKNSKQTIEKLCQFMRESMSEELALPIFKMVIQTAILLYDQNFDEEGLQFFPYYLSLNIDFIKQEFFQPIFDLLVMKYTTDPNHANLTRLSLEIGVEIIKKYAPNHANKLLQVLQSFINKAKGISNIIFLGVLAPYISNKNTPNFLLVEKRITGLFEGDSQLQQKSIAKCMPDLMSFFKEPTKKVQLISSSIRNLNEKAQIGQSYLLIGLLKGIGANQALKHLDNILQEDYPFKTKSDKSARLWQLYVFAQILGRVTQTRALRCTELIISSTADTSEQIRQLARKVGQVLILKMSSYSVKELLPHLLKGLQNEQNWRIKISYIWILGIMAHSSARQLQTSLPVIVPTLSSCLSNAHPTIRDKAAQALSLIGETIKNPQISQCVEILIEALENPFEKSHRALDVLLKTRFSHFIDPPSLSIIIPIVDYCLRGRSSDLKAGACQVIGSICQLIQDPYTLLPYVKLIIGGLRVAICDPLSQIRAIASKSIGMISNKIGASEAEANFKFVIQIIQSPLSNTTEKQGAAQAYSEMICSQDFDYFEESLNKIFDKLNEGAGGAKQGYILVFLYVPGIRTQEFQGFIKEVNENMYIYVSDEDENIRNSAMMVEKVLINNYCISHTDLLLDPLCIGVFQSNWRRRNAALILIGEMLNILKSYMYNTRTSDKSYAYYQGLMAVYILKDDQLQMPRATANQVWNAYIQNTPKTIRTGLNQLVKMWTRFTHSANGVVLTNIVNFSSKYGQNYFFEILQYLDALIEDRVYRKGVFEVLSEFVKRLTQQFLSKQSYKQHIRAFFTKYILVVEEDVRESLARSMALYIQKMHQQAYFDDLLFPQINRMETLSDEDPAYTNNLHLLRDFLHTSSRVVVDRLVRKIFEVPLYNFKIEVITNNADRISNHLYTLFSKPATNILLQEIYTIANNPASENRLKLIVYCLNQVSTNLSVQFRTKYIDLITTSIRELTDNLDDKESGKIKILETLLQMVLFFLGSIPIEEIENLETLISDISVLIKRQGKIVVLTHKIFLLLVSDPKSSKTSLYFKQLLVSLQNNVQDNQIWNNQEILQEYVTVMVQSLAYGNSAIIDQTIRLILFMLSNSKKQIINAQIIRIMGAIVRVASYPLSPSQKISILQFIHQITQLGFSIDIYINQITSVCYRILYELRTNQEIPQIAAVLLEDLLNKSPRKIDFINNMINKYKGFNQNIVRSVYYFLKSMVTKPEVLGKTNSQFIHKELTNCLNQTQNKPPIKEIYYTAKNVGRIGVYLGENIKNYENLLDSNTCSYESLLHYMIFCYYSKATLPKSPRIQLFLKESSREKVYYILKVIKLCLKHSEATKSTYTNAYLVSLVPENLRGFDQISYILQSFQ